MKQKLVIIICSVIIVLSIILIVLGVLPKQNEKENTPIEENEKLVEEDYEGYLTREERKIELSEEQKVIIEQLKSIETKKSYTVSTSFNENPYFVEKEGNEEKITQNDKLIKTIDNEKEKSIIDKLIEFMEVYYIIEKVEKTDDLVEFDTYITAMNNEDYNEFLKIIKSTSYLKDDIAKYNKKYEKFYLIIYYDQEKPNALVFNLSDDDYISFMF